MLYLLIWLIILGASVYFFKKAAGSLSPLKLNLNSIIFYYSFLISSYIGTLFIAMNIDNYYMINRLTHEEIRWIGFYAISFVMLFFPLVMLLVSKMVGFDSKKEFNSYLEKDIELPFSGKNEFFLFLLAISLISLAAIGYTFLKTKHIPILEIVLRRTNLSPGELRIEAQRDFAGNVLIRNIFAIALTPILSLIAYVYSVKTKEIKWKLLFLTLFAGAILINIYDLAKSPIFFYIIMFLLLRMYIGNFHFNWKRLFAWGTAGAILLVGMYVVVQGVTSIGSYLSFNKGPIGRIIFAQIAPTFLHLDTFPNSIPFLNGSSLPASLINLFDMEQVRSARLVMAKVFPEKISDGTAGVLNTLYIAEAYANYGYVGILAGTFYVAFLVQVMYIAFLRLPKNPVFLSLFVYFTINIPRTLVGGFTDFLFNPIWILITCLFVGILLIIRVRMDVWGAWQKHRSRSGT
jgi:oligosaccharide repeat unit polymerase